MSDEENALNAHAGPSAAPEAAADPPTTHSGQPLSKNQQKKLAKRARQQEFKLEKRAAERERRREKQKALSKGLAEGTLTAEQLANVERTRELKRARRAAAKGTEENVWPGAIVIDLGFDNLMTDNEITSMASQLTYVYSANRTARCPMSTILHTSFNPEVSPRLWEKMGKNQWHRWNRMWFWGGGLDTLSSALNAAKAAKEVGGEGQGDEESKGEEQEGWEQLKTAKKNANADRPPTPEDLIDPTIPFPSTRQLVYLSADAEEELTTLSPNEAYIIGGIVDRNRHKNLCQNKAEGLGIRTARLPIGTYLENLPTRKVLTVNQVYEILLNYLALKDWAAAFEAVIPQRKYFQSKDEKKKANNAKRESGPEEEEGGAEVKVAENEGMSQLSAEGAQVIAEEETMNEGEAMNEEDAMNG